VTHQLQRRRVDEFAPVLNTHTLCALALLRPCSFQAGFDRTHHR
jgi:hypothetical protein